MSISKSDIDNLNKKFTYYSPINTSSNIVKTKINILGREINEKNPPFGSYINRPYVDFNPKMELYELEPENLINPSHINFIVPISQPECHKRKYYSSGKNFYNHNNENFNYNLRSVDRKLNNFFKTNFNNNISNSDRNYNRNFNSRNRNKFYQGNNFDYGKKDLSFRNKRIMRPKEKDLEFDSYMREMRQIKLRSFLKANKLL